MRLFKNQHFIAEVINLNINMLIFSMNVQVHCLVENGAVLERADNSSRVSERATGCQNPALVASLLKKGSKMGMNLFFV